MCRGERCSCAAFQAECRYGVTLQPEAGPSEPEGLNAQALGFTRFVAVVRTLVRHLLF